jgi:hypothetical protein
MPWAPRIIEPFGSTSYLRKTKRALMTALRTVLCFLSAGFTFDVHAHAASDVVNIARQYKDGGGYKWKGSGTPEEINFNGERILPRGESNYCSGFTFAVVMKAAKERGLLRDKKLDQIRAFQKDWYGATKGSSETQCALAVERLGIGNRVTPQQARAGDFLQLWRTNKSGHSVVFLEWVKEGRNPIGVKYRSAQTSTNGIGDRIEYFANAPGKNGKVDVERMYFCRLNEKK